MTDSIHRALVGGSFLVVAFGLVATACDRHTRTSRHARRTGDAGRDAAAGGRGEQPGRARVLDMAEIRTTTFRMGCDPGRDPHCGSDERPQHTVKVTGFRIDRTEVPQVSYGACVSSGACSTPASGFDPDEHPARPVTDVTWEQARAYCRWRGARLPTEAEWELAARGTDGRIYPWGDEAPSCARAFTTKDCGPVPADVGGREAGESPYGVLDLAGNVDEWVDGEYAPYGEKPSPGELQRIGRGGAYDAWHSRATARSAFAPDYHGAWLGFRCAESLEPGSSAAGLPSGGLAAEARAIARDGIAMEPLRRAAFERKKHSTVSGWKAFQSQDPCRTKSDDLQSRVRSLEAGLTRRNDPEAKRLGAVLESLRTCATCSFSAMQACHDALGLLSSP